MQVSRASRADSAGETAHDSSGHRDTSTPALPVAASVDAPAAAADTTLPSSSSPTSAAVVIASPSSFSQLKPAFLVPAAAASHPHRSSRLIAAAAPVAASSAAATMSLEFAFSSPQARLYAPFSSPQLGSPHLRYPFSPSIPALDHLAPPLCLPPSAFYYDSASYADDSTVSGVDDFPLLPSVSATEEAEHSQLHRDAFADHDAQQQLQQLYEKEQQQLLLSGKGGDGDVALSLTPALHAVAATGVVGDDTQEAHSAECASSASESPVFSTHASSLPPLSPVLSGHIASPDPHSLPTTPRLPDSHPAACPPLLHGQQQHQLQQPQLSQPAACSPQLRYRATSSIFDEPQPLSPARPPLHPLTGGLPVVPLFQAPTDSICSAPFLPPITHPALPFSPPVPLSQSPSSSLLVSNYIDAAHSAVLNHAKSLQSLPSLSAQQRARAGGDKREKLGRKSSGSVKEDEKKTGRGKAKQTKSVVLKKDRKRKREGSSSSSDDSDDATVTESSSEDDDGGDDESAAAGISASSSALSATARKHRQLRKRQRNKEAAVAYRQRKKALTLSLYSVANTLKTTVQQQSQLIDEVQQDNARLRQQLGFIHKLLSFSQLRPAAPTSPPSPPQQQESAGAEATAAMPATPRPPAPSSPLAVTAAVPISVTSDSDGCASLPLPETTASPSLQSAAAAAAGDVAVKSEPADAAEMAAGCCGDAMGGAAASSAQRASIFLFVIFSCFLLFNPHALQPASRGNDPTFTELTALLLHQHYQQQPQEKQGPAVPPLSAPLSAELEHAAGAASSELWTARQQEGVAALRSFLSGHAGCDEDFFSHLLDTAYTPLVRLVGAAAAQQAISQLAAGVLQSHQKRQQQPPQLQADQADLKAEKSSEAAAAAAAAAPTDSAAV